MVFTIILGLFNTASFAATNERDIISGEIDLTNLQDILDGSTDYEMKGPFTFDELVDEIAKNENITRDEALKRLAPEISEFSLLTNHPYASGMFTTFIVSIQVNSGYRPTVNFYSHMNSINGIPTTFIEVLDVSMNRGYNGISKVFGGNVYINLENANTLFYRVEGDFYNNGTTKVEGGLKIGLGEESDFTFNAEYSTSHYAYHYSTGRIRR